MRQIVRILNHLGFNIWEVRYSDADTTVHVKSFYMFRASLHIPRAGDYVDLDDSRDWIVTQIHHNYPIKEILIFIDKDFVIYKGLVEPDPDLVQMMEDRKKAHQNV